MKDYKFTEGGECVGNRLDKALAHYMNGTHSRSFLKRVIVSGDVRVNGTCVNEKYKIKMGDVIDCVIRPEHLPDEIAAEDIPLDIVYEDDAIAVINKQAGLTVHPGSGRRHHTLVNALLYHFKNLSDAGGPERVGIVHRLDRDTTGLIVIAKNNEAHYKIARQFERKKVDKRYRGFVKGVVEHDNGVIDEPVGRDLRNRMRMCITYAGGSKEALTKFHVLERFDDFTDMEFTLLTGRTHQIRVHMAHLGHPLIGDQEYGRDKGMGRQALHSTFIGFKHPATREHVEFTSPIPKDMENFLNEQKKNKKSRI